MYESQDLGESWNLIGLKDFDIQSFALNDSGFVFAGTSDGVFKSQRSTTDTTGVTTNIELITEMIPETFILKQNFPNPFNPVTTIEFSIPEAGRTRLIMYDLLGREVTRLIDGNVSAGYHSVNWNASNVASGIYFYRLAAGDFVSTKKMVLLR